jgi:hypothetical protein
MLCPFLRVPVETNNGLHELKSIIDGMQLFGAIPHPQRLSRRMNKKSGQAIS